MAIHSRASLVIFGSAALLASAMAVKIAGNDVPAELRPIPDATGSVQTVTTNDTFDTDNPFFQSLGTNGRACATCHTASNGWTVTPSSLQQRFAASDGLDPVFRPNDGATCPSADVSTVDARRTAYALLLAKGLIRVSLPVPSNAEFTVVEIDDPYQCATPFELGLYRRPLPSTNLRFLSTVMWDGRETAPRQSIENDLLSQARDATLGHAQATMAPPVSVLKQIVDFESGLFTAQVRDRDAGSLTADGALGGPFFLAQQPFFIGINDPLGQNPTGAAFDPHVFTIFNPWVMDADRDPSIARARRSVARGQEIFNTRPISITDVGGLSDVVGPMTGTCSTCHDTPNAGTHSVSMPLNIGTSDASRRTPDLPLYTLRCSNGQEIRTSDPGRAMITGKCSDIGKLKGPTLRALAAHAPYFHNGSAATLEDVVEFYDTRFHLGLKAQEKRDLVAFLRSL